MTGAASPLWTRASASTTRARSGSASSRGRSAAGLSRASGPRTSIPITWATPAGSPSAGGPTSGARKPRGAHYRRHGCGEEALALLARRGNPYPRLVPTVAPAYRRIRDGDALEIGGRRWEVLTVLGHAPEHACLWCRELGVLISGDQVLPKITTNVSVWPEEPMGNPLRLYLDSLERFRSMAPATLVLPSHGLPSRGLHARLGALRDHHAARLAEALDVLVEPLSAAELVPTLFRRELDVHQLGFALGESLAHLRLLESDDRVVRVVGKDGVHRFRKA